MWINTNTAGTFVLHADIRYECWKSGIELPGVLTDEVLAEYGYMPVTKITPVYNPITQGLSAQPCISNEGAWEQHFVVYDLDPAIAANNQAIIDARERARWQTVTMRQARLALLNAGRLGQVNTALAAMPGDQGEAARIEWEFSSTVMRGQPLVAALAPILGMTDADLDQLFIAAAGL